jgi:hypothetical protein
LRLSARCAVVGRDALAVSERAALGLEDVLEARTLGEVEAAGAAVGARLLAGRSAALRPIGC